MHKLNLLQNYFSTRPPMAIAVSGGVDSMTLAVVAHRSKPGTEIYHAISPAVPPEATQRVRRYEEQERWQLAIVNAGEVQDPAYLANPANRCYFCKTNLYDTLAKHTSLTLASGTNLDDLGDYRPGLLAAKEHQVCHPYVELGIDKPSLRRIAGELQLHDLKALPAAPCLASRVTTGIAIDASLLPVINEAEQLVWRQLKSQLPLTGVRCRIKPDGLSIQLESASAFDASSPCYPPLINAVQALFRQRGFAARARLVTVEPYQRGSAFLVDPPTGPQPVDPPTGSQSVGSPTGSQPVDPPTGSQLIDSQQVQ